MKMVDWAMWAFLETTKYMILTYMLLGFKMRAGKWKYMIFLYTVAGIFLWYMDMNVVLYKTLWGFLVISIFFEGCYIKKIQSFFLEYMLISAVDIIVWCVIVCVTNLSLDNEHYEIKWMADFLGMLIWGIIALQIKKYTIEIHKIFQDMKWKSYGLMLVPLFSIVVIASFAQGYVMGKLSDNGKKIMLIFCIMGIFCVGMVIAVMAYMWQRKNQLEMIQELTRRCYDYQKNYYEGIIKKDEELRGFQHDIRKHISVIAVLCEEKKIENIQSYIAELQGELEKMTVYRTGNSIADYFIGHMIEEICACGDVNYTIIGRFPEKMRLSENELCILLGNAMDNAKEALLKYKGTRRLEIKIKSYKEKLYLTIANSTNDNELNLTSAKKDKKNHGYGIKNMERVTEKYGGKIEYTLDKGMFVLQIEV